jgi:hypothetical protein
MRDSIHSRVALGLLGYQSGLRWRKRRCSQNEIFILRASAGCGFSGKSLLRYVINLTGAGRFVLLAFVPPQQHHNQNCDCGECDVRSIHIAQQKIPMAPK